MVQRQRRFKILQIKVDVLIYSCSYPNAGLVHLRSKWCPKIVPVVLHHSRVLNPHFRVHIINCWNYISCQSDCDNGRSALAQKFAHGFVLIILPHILQEVVYFTYFRQKNMLRQRQPLPYRWKCYILGFITKNLFKIINGQHSVKWQCFIL